VFQSHKTPTTKLDESGRSTCFGVRADGSWGVPARVGRRIKKLNI